MRITCTHCGKRYKLASKFENKKLRCKKCKQVFRARNTEKSVDSEEYAVVAEAVDDDEQDNFLLNAEALAAVESAAPLPAQSFSSYQPKPKQLSRRDKLAGAKKRERAQQMGQEPESDYVTQIGWTLVMMGISTNIAHMFGYVLRRLRFLGEYAPVGGLILILIGAVILACVYYDRNPVKGAIYVAFSLTIGLGVFTVNMVRGPGGQDQAVAAATNNQSSFGRLKVTSNRGNKEEIKLSPPSSTGPTESPWANPVPGRSFDKQRRGLRPPSSTPFEKPQARPAPDRSADPRGSRRMPPVSSFDSEQKHQETLQHFNEEVGRQMENMERQHAELKLHSEVRRRNNALRRKMDSTFGVRYRTKLPQEMLSTSAGVSFGRPQNFMDSDKQVVVGLAAFPKTYPDGRRVVGEVTPFFESDVLNEDPLLGHGVTALEGYAVFAVRVAESHGKITGMQVVFAKFTDGSYDADDSYESEWLVDEPKSKEVVTVGGTGDPVIGIFRTRSIDLRAFGLILNR